MRFWNSDSLHKAKSSDIHKRSRRLQFRRLLAEQLENRQLLTAAQDDSYSTAANQTLDVSADGAWSNDSYHSSWDETAWGCTDSQYHEEEYWENGVWVDGDWDYSDPESPQWIPEHWDYSNATYHPQGWHCHAEGEITATQYPWGGIESWPVHGSLTLSDNGARAFRYEPNNNFVGTDTFAYYISDDEGASSATVTIHVYGPPEANDDNFVVNQYDTLDDTVLGNDTGNSLVVTLSSGVVNGSLALNADGTFSYTPNAGFYGDDSFGYTINDGLNSDSAIVTIHVNAPPAANKDLYSTSVTGGSITVEPTESVLLNDTDANGDSLTASLVAGPSHGTLTLNSDGSFTYIAAAGFHGVDRFTYTAWDGDAASEVATVFLAVNNHEPADNGTSFSYYQDTPVFVDAAHGLLANASDEDGDSLTASLTTQPAHGTVFVYEDGSFRYIPEAGYVGYVSFEYCVSDGGTLHDPIAEGESQFPLTVSWNGSPMVQEGETAHKMIQGNFEAGYQGPIPTSILVTYHDIPIDALRNEDYVRPNGTVRLYHHPEPTCDLQNDPRSAPCLHYDAIVDIQTLHPKYKSAVNTLAFHIDDAVAFHPGTYPIGIAIFQDDNMVSIFDTMPEPIDQGCSCNSPSSPLINGMGNSGTIETGVSNSGGPSGISDSGVQYGNGGAYLSSRSLSSSAEGLDWGVELDYANLPGNARSGQFGNGWMDKYHPFLIKSENIGEGGQVVVMSGSLTLDYFSPQTSYDEKDASNRVIRRHYTSTAFHSEAMVEDVTYVGSSIEPATDTYTLTDATGARFVFNGFHPSMSPQQKGELTRYVDSANHETTLAWTANGLTTTRTLADSTTEQFSYSFVTLSDQQILVESVTESRAGQTVRTVEYKYYTPEEASVTDPNGNAGDLKMVTVKEGTKIVEQSYYRYYTSQTEHGVKYVVSGDNVNRLNTAAGGNIENANNQQIDANATRFYQYHPDHRVKTVRQEGASGSISYAYEENTNINTGAEDYNWWTTKTTEALPYTDMMHPDPNGISQNIIYTNFRGEVMVKIYHHEYGPTNNRTIQEWITFYRYDDQGRLLYTADSAAVFGLSESSPDLMGFDENGHSPYLQDHLGLIADNVYYAENDTSVGSAPGRLKDVAIRNGELGNGTGTVVIDGRTEILQSRTTYKSHVDSSGVTTYLVDTSTTYPSSTTMDGALATHHEYVFFPDPAHPTQELSRIKSVAITDPSGAVTETVFDSFGRPIWEKDAAGSINYTAYDPRTGAVKKRVVDIQVDATNAEIKAEYDNLTPPWTTTGARLRLVTKYDSDSEGRTTMVTDANGHVTVTVYRDDLHDVRTYPGYDSTSNTTTGPITVTRENRASGYRDVLTLSATPHLTAGVLDGTEAITVSTLQSLTRTLFDSLGNDTETREYFSFKNASGANLPDSSINSLDFGLVNVNFRSTKYLYDVRGELTATIRNDGTVNRNVYDGLGRVVSEWIGTNQSPTWSPLILAGMTKISENTYDNGGVGASYLTASATFDTRQRKTTYVNDFRGRQTSVTLPDPDGDGPEAPIPPNFTTYDNLGRVKTSTDALGNTTTYVYDDLTRTTQTIFADPDGPGIDHPLLAPEIIQIRNSRGLIESMTDGRGVVTFYEYDGAGRQISITIDSDGEGPESYQRTRTQYDAVGNVTSTIDPNGNTTENHYDRANRLWYVTLPAPDWNAPYAHPQIVYQYDAAGGLQYLTDADGNTTSYEYDRLGNILDVTQPVPDGIHAAPVTRYDYDTAGRQWHVYDARQKVTTYQYDLFDHVSRIFYPDPDDDGPLQAPNANFTYDTAGQLRATLNTNYAAATTYTYDLAGRLIKKEEPTTAQGRSTTLYGYDAAGNLTTVTDPNQNVTTYGYDYLNRKISETTPDPDGTGSAHPLLPAVTIFGYDENNNLVTRTDASVPVGRITIYEYDFLNRLASTTTPDPDGVGPLEPSVTRYGYDSNGNLTTVTDPLNHTTSYAFDALNRKIREMAPWESGAVTTYTYDYRGNQLSLTDPDGNTTTWEYDGLSRVHSETNELEKTRTYEYDANNNLIKRVDRLGRTIVYGYDNLNRNTSEQWLDGETPIRTFTFGYDLDSRLTLASDSAATYIYQYDNAGRMLEEKQDIAGLMDDGLTPDNWVTPDVQYSSRYNMANFRSSLQAAVYGAPDFLNTYTPDSLQRLATVTQQSILYGNEVAPKRVDFTYNGNNQVTQIARYASTDKSDFVINSFYAYDPLSRLSQLTHTTATTAPTPGSGFGTNAKAGYAYGYDAASRITSLNSRNDSSLTYGYDVRGQLTSASDGAATNDSYSYDANGNRSIPWEHYGPAVGPNNQQLWDGHYQYTYDDEGNRLTRTDTTTGEREFYAWDYRNRLLSVRREAPDPEPVEGWGVTYANSGSGGALLSAFAAPASEGQSLRITAYPWPGNYIEYWTVDRSATRGSDYTSSATEQNKALVSTQFSNYIDIPLRDDDLNESTESFEVHIQLSGMPETEIVLEADIIDTDGPTVLSLVNYSYDAFNRLVKRTLDADGDGSAPASSTFYSYEAGQVALEFDGASYSDIAHRYLWGPAVDQLLADEMVSDPYTPGPVTWPLADHLGTIRDLATHDSTSGATTVALHRQYDAFGNLVSAHDANSEAVDLNAAAQDEIFGYTGRMFDTATGLQNNLNRWYDPKAGRWVSEDPAGFLAGDTNLVRYVGNVPTMRVDPSGLKWTIHRRTTDSWAWAEAGSSEDTIKDLANRIRLDASEYKKWLKTDGLGEIKSEFTGNLENRCLAVPNVISIYEQWPSIKETAAHVFGEDHVIDIWNKYIQKVAIPEWNKRGFKVDGVMANSPTLFKKQWNVDGIYRFVYTGHGTQKSAPSVVTMVNYIGWPIAISGPSDVSPPYKLSVVAMFACSSNAEYKNSGVAGSWRTHLSELGLFIGYDGEATADNWSVMVGSLDYLYDWYE